MPDKFGRSLTSLIIYINNKLDRYIKQYLSLFCCIIIIALIYFYFSSNKLYINSREINFCLALCIAVWLRSNQQSFFYFLTFRTTYFYFFLFMICFIFCFLTQTKKKQDFKPLNTYSYFR
jgi:hypothetical protein